MDSSTENRLSPCVKQLLQPYFPEFDLGAIVIQKYIPSLLLGFVRVEPCAMAIGNTLYFAPGEYDPVTRGGIACIAHEVQHAVQWRRLGRLRFMQQYLSEFRSHKSKGMSDQEAYEAVSLEREAADTGRRVFNDLSRQFGRENPCGH